MATTTTRSSDPGAEPGQTGDGVEISAPRARQAYPGRRIMWILLASLAAVVLAFAISFAINSTEPASDDTGDAGVVSPADAQLFSAPEPAPRQPS
jgi:hypothetical protein